MKIKDLCKDNFIFFDGAMGTMLLKSGLKSGEIPEIYNLTHPQIITDIHRQYIEAGADIITTNTFGANELKLKGTGYSVEEVIEAAINNAKAANPKFIALDIGPIGQLMKPMGTLSFKESYDIFAKEVIAGVNAGADLIIIETLSDLYEAKAAILAAKENSKLPVICTLTFGSDRRTLTGTDPLTMVNVLQGLGIDALGVNCSLGPNELMPIVEEILKYSQIPVIVQPNAGLPKFSYGETTYDLSSQEFATVIKNMAQIGVKIIGGCCGTTPEYIKAVRKILDGMKPVETFPEKITCASSSVETVIIGQEAKVIGERINPTGKKILKEALLQDDIDYIVKEAINQKNAGADILDVNVGLPGIDEANVMAKCISAIQEVVTLPLQIDSTDPGVIEKASRIYNGKPLINSVNGEKKIMDAIFPIAKKYGACVIGLTLDEKGIPKTAGERLEIARKIIDTAKEYGISKEDIIIDCLVMPVSAGESTKTTLDAVELVKNELGVNTVLGVSNVSFGLPQREIINSTYLAVALAKGLDVAIINPLCSEIMNTLNSYKVLDNQDKDAKRFIELYSNVETGNKNEIKNNDLKEIIIDGRREEAVMKVKEMLKNAQPMEIINQYIIPALNVVGKKYQSGETFLPQLIQSAEAVKSAFEVLKQELKKNSIDISKGKIILATVKGDIHDIGKNIVKILLENYGYQVLDLGKDVPAEEIVNSAKANNIKLVGLSSLMTTTLKSMEETINELRQNQISCKVMVGGAVLNEEYAKAIGADYYAKEAIDGVDIAKKVFDNEEGNV